MSRKGCLYYLVIVVVVGFLLYISSGFLAKLGIDTIMPEPVLPTILLPAESITPTVEILGFKTGLTNTMLTTLLTAAFLITVSYFGTKKLRQNDESSLVPSGLQNTLEAIIEAIYNLAQTILGKRTRQVFWLGATIFLFVLVANWMELIPGFDSIGLLEHPHEEGITAYNRAELGPIGILKGPAITEAEASPTEGEHAEEAHAEETHAEETHAEDEHHADSGWVLVPFLRAANTDLNVTLMLALVSVVMTQYYSIRALGAGGYFGKFIQTKSIGEGNPMGLLDTFVGVLEAISEFSKIISFTFRLFGNIFAGAVLLFVMGYLIPFLFPGVMIFYGLELFVGAIQALVFMMLTFVFISTATVAHGEDH
ncbi:MAG: F0F1 ATP synthase subunit A [Chloroflexota bacterium]